MSAAAGGLPLLALCRLLIGLRLRLLRNRLRRGPQAGTARFAAFFALLGPAAYVGLFVSALGLIGAHGGAAAETGAIALVTSAIVLSSAGFRVAGAEGVTGIGGETEFLLARPVSMATLVLARGLTAVVTDLYDALFLLPVLAAAALAFRLGAGALLVAALTSALVQVAVSALVQVGQIAIVRLVPPARRRLVTTVCALAAAFALAVLWMAGGTVLRAPAAAARALLDHQRWLDWLPGQAIAAPLVALRANDPLAAARALGTLTLAAAGALALAGWVARAASRRGWEQADAPWVIARPTDRAGPPLGLFGKDLRQLLRDRPRLITFLGLPVLLIGIQVFGSAGWSWLTGDRTRTALVAYSVAAYAATFGPLQHMAAERRAFWLLRMAPVSMGRLLAAKAAFWACAVAGLAALVYTSMSLLSPAHPAGRGFLDGAVPGALAVLGAAAVAFLAVGLAAAVADLSDDTRPPIGLSATYLFMLVAGLYNIVILSAGQARWQALLLYAVAIGAAWVTGVDRAATLFDPEEMRRRLPSAPVGALGLILLLLGERATRVIAFELDADSSALAGLPWLALLAAGLAIHRLRRRPAARPIGWPAALLTATALGVAGALLSGLGGSRVPGLDGPWLVLLARPLVEELAARGVLQAGLQRAEDSRLRRAVLAVASALAVWAVSAHPFSAPGIVRAVIPAVSLAITGRLAGALTTRALIELFPLLLRP